MSRLTMGQLLYNGEQTSQESASTNKRPTSNIAPVRNVDCHGGSQDWDTRGSAVNVICEACTEFWLQEAKSELDKCRTYLKNNNPAVYVASCLGGCTFSVTLLILLLLEFRKVFMAAGCSISGSKSSCCTALYSHTRCYQLHRTGVKFEEQKALPFSPKTMVQVTSTT